MTKGISPVAVGGVTMLYAAILLWGLAFLLELPTNMNPSAEAWLGLIALGVVGSALPGVLMFVLLQRAGAEFISLYGYILPLLGIVVAWIAFGRAPEMTFLLGVTVLQRNRLTPSSA